MRTTVLGSFGCCCNLQKRNNILLVSDNVNRHVNDEPGQGRCILKVSMSRRKLFWTQGCLISELLQKGRESKMQPSWRGHQLLGHPVWGGLAKWTYAAKRHKQADIKDNGAWGSQWYSHRILQIERGMWLMGITVPRLCSRKRAALEWWRASRVGAAM